MIAAGLLLTAFAAQAQTQPGAELRTLEDMARAMRDAMEAFGESIAPWAEQLGRLLDDPGAYESPELLPNGDILIRRKADAPPLKQPDAAPGLDL
ncbi:MAG: hypothetical protein CVT86_02575 [Alphaproteobacteria bacterium HGW-Alphaproteobacteria-8]|jgi:hypothetical protein|nr:MAG: hypothetical protein CVT86_02575 [Alphaproteobacteria bacterium HGW-Alphaproteobacteria-8]